MLVVVACPFECGCGLYFEEIYRDHRRDAKTVEQEVQYGVDIFTENNECD